MLSPSCVLRWMRERNHTSWDLVLFETLRAALQIAPDATASFFFLAYFLSSSLSVCPSLSPLSLFHLYCKCFLPFARSVVFSSGANDDELILLIGGRRNLLLLIDRYSPIHHHNIKDSIIIIIVGDRTTNDGHQFLLFWSGFKKKKGTIIIIILHLLDLQELEYFVP